METCPGGIFWLFSGEKKIRTVEHLKEVVSFFKEAIILTSLSSAVNNKHNMILIAEAKAAAEKAQASK